MVAPIIFAIGMYFQQKIMKKGF